ncbi:GDSL-type esterase/lipase family protein [Calothrix sp. UHCC 0171]|uniref:GDSL-type esterase/lipase family protein n=1 Tax=Calothrix sp. UHCC 0171 TaxID=3110245 RepID=UPI002B21E318|nr:GDSL-type esterase/lipase family protein [Calothrix sp. UHCC 0171]MEA5570684.1 GDSL-type esterase/lipase family protein [Calothrix sp. UHCC 0171]
MKPEQESQVRICFVGESFVNGTGDSECLGWTGRICVDANKRGYDITYYNLGVRRETTEELKQRWRNEVIYRLPSDCNGRVVFSFGVNDTVIINGKLRVSLLNSIFNVRQILREAKELYPVLMVGPPPMLDNDQNTRIAELSKYFARICRELDIPYLDVFSVLKQSNIWFDEVYAYDKAHPRAGGYQAFADIVKNWDAWLNWLPNRP